MTKKKQTYDDKCAAGMRKLLSLGYTQAQLARMFDVDAATISQWIRLQRVGAWRVARVEFIPELRDRISVRELRPDLTHADKSMLLAQATGEARAWAGTQRKRAHEAPFAVRTTKRATTKGATHANRTTVSA